MSDQSAPSVTSQLKQGVYSSIGCLGVIGFSIILLIVALVGPPNGRSKTPQSGRPAPAIPQKNPYRYLISERSDVSLRGMPRMVVRVRLETDDLPTRERMIDTAAEIWAQEKQQWTQFTVFMIGGEIRDFGAGAYGIAEFAPTGMRKFEVNDVPVRMLKIKAAIANQQELSEKK